MSVQCEDCSVAKKSPLKKNREDVSNVDYVIALAGNPNVGKSTVFNMLTGLRQHTGNWPGKTVSLAMGGFTYNSRKYKVVDLPGTYSLLSMSTDEEVARDFILFENPDVTVIVADATCLERNLNLVLQILDITDKVVLCVNLIDEAEKMGIKIDERSLSRQLGIPVALTSARRNRGLDVLLNYIEEVVTRKYICKPRKTKIQDKKISAAVNEIVKKLDEIFPELLNKHWIAMRLIEDDPGIKRWLENKLKGIPG